MKTECIQLREQFMDTVAVKPRDNKKTIVGNT
jgi:hypothetical protein